MHRIIDSCRQEGFWSILEKPSKKGLVALSLTCRYWADMIRRSLFASLTLYSGEDVAQLIEFLKGPDILPTPLNKCILQLYIIQNETRCAPCLHLMAGLPYMPKGFGNAFVMSGSGRPPAEPDSDSKSSKAAPAIPKFDYLPFALLPRSIPGIVFQIHGLVLAKLHLRRRMDLARFIDNLPRLKSCELFKLTFVEEGGSVAEEDE